MSLAWAVLRSEALEEMKKRNREWQERYALSDCPYFWDLDAARITFDREDDHVAARIAVVGTTSKHEGTFLWSWANRTIPRQARAGIEVVQRRGEQEVLCQLTDGEFPAGRAEATEILAVSAWLMNARGTFIDETGDVTVYLALFDFHVVPAGG